MGHPGAVSHLLVAKEVLNENLDIDTRFAAIDGAADDRSSRPGYLVVCQPPYKPDNQYGVYRYR